MRIQFLLTQSLDSPSGLGRYWPLARELGRLGHQVSVFALHPDLDGLQEPRFEREGVKVHYVAPMHVKKQGNLKSYYPARKLLSLSAGAAWQLSRAVLSEPAEAIQICKPHPMNSIAGLAGRYFQGKTLFLDCDDLEAASNRFSGAWQRRGVAFFEDRLPRLVRHVTTHTHFLRQRMIEHGVPEEQITYLPNGVDPERFKAPQPEQVHALRRQLGLDGLQVVAFIGSLSLPSHPVDLLLEAFREVHRTQPKSVLLLVGGGEDLVRLKQMADEPGLGAAIRFCGRVDPAQVPLYYRLADVSVDPVRDDDAARGRSPLKMFESWICGTPFITADVGDRRALTGSPPAGLLVQPGDAGSLAEGILQVLRHPETASSIREQGLERVKNFTWSRLARDMEAVYLQAVTQRGLPERG